MALATPRRRPYLMADLPALHTYLTGFLRLQDVYLANNMPIVFRLASYVRPQLLCHMGEYKSEFEITPNNCPSTSCTEG